MELVEGASWNDHLRDAAPGLRERLALFLQVCEGVAFLHREGVLHRDLKPGNLRVDPNGRVRILDFGLVRTLDASTLEVTRAGEPLGTSQYMSPEQWHDSSRVDERSDVYSLGVILFELAGGELAAELPSSGDMWREEGVLGLRARGELAVDRDLRAIIGSALELDPAARTSDPEALALDLLRYLTDRPVVARHSPLAHRARLFLRRYAAPLRRLAAAAGILLACSLVAAREWSRSEGYRRGAEAEVSCTLAACEFILDELEGGTAMVRKLQPEDLVATLDEVLVVLATLSADGGEPGPAAPLAERARALRAALDSPAK
jgi:serine/threonine-protein kinase